MAQEQAWLERMEQLSEQNFAQKKATQTFSAARLMKEAHFSCNQLSRILLKAGGPPEGRHDDS